MLGKLVLMARRVRKRVSARTAAETVTVDPRQLAMFLKEAMQGVAPDGPLHTLREIWTWWKSVYLQGLGSADSFEGRMENHLLPVLGDLTPETLTPAAAEAALTNLKRATVASKDKRKARPVGPQTVKHVRNCGRKVLNDAIRLGKWKGKNPFVGLQNLPKVKRKKHRELLTPAEALRLLGEIRPSLRPLYAVAIYLGARKVEVLGLKQRDVRLDRGVIVIRRPKTGVDSEIPIPDELVPHLKAALLVAQGDFLFSRPDGRPLRGDTKLELILRSALGRANIVYGHDHKCRRCGRMEHHQDATRRPCDRCGMLLWVSAVPRKITFHGLRHVSSNLHRRAGCDPLVIRELLGHEVDGLAVTDTVYTHIDEAYMRVELNRLSLFQQDNPPSGGGAGPLGGGTTGDNSPRPPEPKATGSNPVSRAFFPETPHLLTAREVGAVLRLSVTTVRKMHRSGKLPGVWVGVSLRFVKGEVVAFLAKGGAR